jgi:hypothetical protein
LAKRLGITVEFTDEPMDATAVAYTTERRIKVQRSLLKLHPMVLWYVLDHEIGHVVAGHAETETNPARRAAWELDADSYSRQAMTVADPHQDLVNKLIVAAYLWTLASSGTHLHGFKIALDLLNSSVLWRSRYAANAAGATPAPALVRNTQPPMQPQRPMVAAAG